MSLTGPPAGIVSVGGYRFLLNELEDAVQGANGGAFVVALPDALAGHRLAGISSGGDVRAALRRTRRQSAAGRCLSGGVTGSAMGRSWVVRR